MKDVHQEVKSLRELSALHQISKSMQTLDLEEILHLILEGVTRVIGFDRTRLYLIDEQKKELECKMAMGIEREKIKDIRLPLDEKNSMVARSVMEKKSFNIENALTDSRVNKNLKELFGLKSFAVVPILGRDRVLGAITADNLFTDRIITPEKFESLITFANQAGLALENAKMYDELKSFNTQLEEKIKIATRKLRKTQDKLIQSEKMAALGKLSAGIAHEIKNPLTSIKLLVHSLAKEIQHNEIAKKDIEVIENEIERVNQIINRFFDFARPKEPEFSSVDINQVLEEIIALISGEIKEWSIIIEKEFLPLSFIQADKGQIKQVFLNLFLNAIQVMPNGGKVKVGTRQEDKHIQIEIQDEGEGIAEDIKNKLFEPFFTTKEEGIGLGLSIVKRIIEDHKGWIRIDNAKPKGAIVTIAFPCIDNKKNESIKN
ncbi:GAF domain-containing protein [bacterium]|nr:GAF domain-containing protein [bacterium]